MKAIGATKWAPKTKEASKNNTEKSAGYEIAHNHRPQANLNPTSVAPQDYRAWDRRASSGNDTEHDFELGEPICIPDFGFRIDTSYGESSRAHGVPATTNKRPGHTNRSEHDMSHSEETNHGEANLSLQSQIGIDDTAVYSPLAVRRTSDGGKVACGSAVKLVGLVDAPTLMVVDEDMGMDTTFPNPPRSSARAPIMHGNTTTRLPAAPVPTDGMYRVPTQSGLSDVEFWFLMSKLQGREIGVGEWEEAVGEVRGMMWGRVSVEEQDVIGEGEELY
jgi:hypothetical protein